MPVDHNNVPARGDSDPGIALARAVDELARTVYHVSPELQAEFLGIDRYLAFLRYAKVAGDGSAPAR